MLPTLYQSATISVKNMQLNRVEPRLVRYTVV